MRRIPKGCLTQPPSLFFNVKRARVNLSGQTDSEAEGSMVQACKKEVNGASDQEWIAKDHMTKERRRKTAGAVKGTNPNA